MKINKILEEDMQYIAKSVNNPEVFKNSTILVTGCAGFLGYYFMNFFDRYAESFGIKKVIGLDSFRLGRPAWINSLTKSGKAEVHDFDVSVDDIASVKGAENANFIIHMASIASPTFYRLYPVETLDANIWGLRKLLEFYKNKKIESLLFFSSSEVYGDPDPSRMPIDEEYRGNVATIGPRACYDESKRFGETMCYIFANKYKIPIAIVRPFNNYGPGMRLDDGRVPADFSKAVFENKDIVILSDGTPTRTFCYVADAVVGYIKAMIYGKFGYFNIGVEAPEISIRDLANKYAEIGRDVFGYTGSVKFGASIEASYLTHNPSRRCPSIEKASNALGYTPSITLEEGIRRFLEFVKITGGVL